MTPAPYTLCTQACGTLLLPAPALPEDTKCMMTTFNTVPKLNPVHITPSPTTVPAPGAQRAAAARGVALVAPDTSPRGLGVEGESASWDFGVGAGFYVNATQVRSRGVGCVCLKISLSGDCWCAAAVCACCGTVLALLLVLPATCLPASSNVH